MRKGGGRGGGKEAYQISDIVSDLEFPECSCSFGMDDTLGDTFSVEMGKEVDEMEVLEQDWTVVPDSLRGSCKSDWTTIRGRIDGACGCCHC